MSGPEWQVGSFSHSHPQNLGGPHNSEALSLPTYQENHICHHVEHRTAKVIEVFSVYELIYCYLLPVRHKMSSRGHGLGIRVHGVTLCFASRIHHIVEATWGRSQDTLCISLHELFSNYPVYPLVRSSQG